MTLRIYNQRALQYSSQINVQICGSRDLQTAAHNKDELVEIRSNFKLAEAIAQPDQRNRKDDL
jgi:hypothetical protein